MVAPRHGKQNYKCNNCGRQHLRLGMARFPRHPSRSIWRKSPVEKDFRRDENCNRSITMLHYLCIHPFLFRTTQILTACLTSLAVSAKLLISSILTFKQSNAHSVRNFLSLLATTHDFQIYSLFSTNNSPKK